MGLRFRGRRMAQLLQLRSAELRIILAADPPDLSSIRSRSAGSPNPSSFMAGKRFNNQV